jgi:hypothetical protein
VTGEVSDLLAGIRVVEGDDARVACGSETFGARGEFEGADWFDEAGEGVEEARGRGGEDVD